MKVCIYDPLPMGNEYATKMFFAPMRAYAGANGIPCSDLVTLTDIRGAHVVLLTDHLSDERIMMLKNNGNKIIGLNVTDSSYISQAIRYAKSLQLMDLIFMVSGVQKVNTGTEIAVDNNFNVTLVDKPFLDPDNWERFDFMRRSGRLQSLPYVPWTPIPEVERQPWRQRSQKTILRGGGHARRFLLAMFLDAVGKLDPNSGFVLHPYFDENMNPQFRYCDECRADYKQHRHARMLPPSEKCNSPAHGSFDGPELFEMSDLGQWNNRCPRSFYWMAERFSEKRGAISRELVESMLNARWLHPKEHMERLGRILFTSDLKWVHSIYKPQRFWEAAAAGCINVLPMRTLSQDYFPNTVPIANYLVFEETMGNLELAFSLDEPSYREMADDTRRIYDTWIAPSVFGINTNLLTHMFDEMRKA
jgi:hypothetical protein